MSAQRPRTRPPLAMLGFGVAAFAVLLSSLPESPVAADAREGFPFTGLARPHRSAAIGVEVTGVLHTLHVAPGDEVVAGQPLFQLDISVESLAAERAAARAHSRYGLAMAEATLNKALQDEAKIRELLDQGIESDTSYDDAALAARLAGLSVDEARYEQKDALVAHRESLARIARRRAKAPFQGVVDLIHKEVGEAIDQLDPVVELVQLDPLRIELHCPSRWSDALVPGSRVPVVRVGWPEDVRSARVVFRSQRVDAASQTTRVHLELANGSNDPTRPAWPAGIKVLVGAPGAANSGAASGHHPSPVKNR